MPAALVTGVSRRAGIAAGVARTLAREGWDVATTCWRPYDETEPWESRPEEAEEIIEELRAFGVRADLYEDDLADAAAPVRILDAAEAAIGPLTALVCVHAHSETGGLLETDAAQLDRMRSIPARPIAGGSRLSSSTPSPKRHPSAGQGRRRMPQSLSPFSAQTGAVGLTGRSCVPTEASPGSGFPAVAANPRSQGRLHPALSAG